MLTKETLAKNIKEAVDYFKNDGDGCYTFKLDDTLAVCVGWSDGYDPNDNTVIHSKSSPTFCVNAGIKVWTSDDLRTDFDWINFPYYENGEVWDNSLSISPNEDYISTAEWFLKEYESLSELEIDKHGKILEAIK